MDLSKARARRERIRLQKHSAPQKSPEKAPDFDHYAAERTTGLISRLARDREFAGTDELNAFLEENVRGRKLEEIEATFPQDSKWPAQELAYDAMNQSSGEAAERLAREAIAIDPGCVDALCVLADRLPTAQDRVAELSRIVAAAEEAFGADFMRENKGHFWGIHETRPYMRARFDLAMALMVTGGPEEAMPEMSAMLDLNPNDNQGVRELLAPIALAADLPLAGRILNEMFIDDDTAVMNRGRVLYWALEGDFRLAIKALRDARRQNPYVEEYFTGHKKTPKHLPDTYQWGRESEAAHAAFHLAHIFTALREPLRILASVPDDFDLDPPPPDRRDPTRIQ
jgi:tetratricopeptide (TPR) repeat protein